ncbi:MAG: hypothetical protein LBB57_04850 [Clostridiales Family XIII bacterium]|nr:hypothetical protein [Clostridiales Family XIII bacterium]
MLNGKWDMILHSPMGDKAVIFEAAEEGEALTGRFSADSGWNTEIYEGKVDEAAFSFKVDFPVPAMGSFTFTLKGEADGDTMSGIAKMAVGKCKFEAKRI